MFAPSGIVGKINDVLKRGREARPHFEVLAVLKKALPWMTFPESSWERRDRMQPAKFDIQPAHSAERRCFAVDGSAGKTLHAPSSLVFTNALRCNGGG
jgi:hypothetical protein